MVAATVGTAGDLDTAEDCAQRAFERALETWRPATVPSNPVGWLVRTARNHALDLHRRAGTLRARAPELVLREEARCADAPVSRWNDDLLRLVFTCCHPALLEADRVLLTLRVVCGLPTPTAAGLLLLKPATAAARLTRARRKIASAGVRYAVPSAEDLPGRLDAVLAVVHLVATAAHERPRSPETDSLEQSARGLSTSLAEIFPEEPEVLGLLGLVLFTQARTVARRAAEAVLLDGQDRGSWDPRLMAGGREATSRAIESALARDGRAGRYALQAAIAGVHTEAASVETTDWPALLRLYDRLLEVWPTSVVRLNRAVAVSYVHGASAALAEVDAVADDPSLREYPYLPAVRARLLADLGRTEEAAAAYRRAVAVAGDDDQRRFLKERLEDLDR
ncbi:RNA polymerase sigma factor [Mumia zhuanghuii]|uniref:RNA polymerase sigma factor n=1 Tax=Mumia zhuanghuii TaxID=2585211 RepID=A0A5C4MBQ2_9ACTN|nr:RNA polymerase sigma factor [Mumia zhuanghuii]